jgi:tRNA nucleotidyltransferase/poly(A) polymerase
MKCFNEWLSESSLRQQLKVPQNPKHHPEGGVDRHTMMVRSSLEPAIKILQEKQKNDPSGPLSNLDLSFASEDMNILRLAGLLHDIGKGDTLDPVKLSAHGHEDPENFEKAMQRLGPIWHQMYSQSNQSDKDDLWWVIKYHMSLKDKEGFQNKSLKKEILDDQGKYKPDRKIKLLLVFLLMDRMGRGGESGIPWQKAKQFAQGNTSAAARGLEGIDATASMYKQDLDKIASRASKPMSSDPVGFVSSMREKGKPNEIIRSALRGRFPNLTDTEITQLLGESRMKFKVFFESEEDKPSTMEANIPLGKFQKGAQLISDNFKSAGFTIYIVGGTVRDYLMSQFHDVPFKIKDVDFATNATSDEVKQVLINMGIEPIAKGESFGVISAVIDKIEYEIATFREESGYSDNRRPDTVKPSDAKNDYRRRDFTINALYYEMPNEFGGQGTIIDYGKGQGLEDIKQKKIRPVGSAEDRFGEDRLRVLRGVRFHGIFNKENLKDIVDPETFEAMKKFSTLEGVSPERIQAEFVAALFKARDPKVILHGFESIGALPYMFPGLVLDMEAVDHLANLPSLPNVSGLEAKEQDKIEKNHNKKKVILTLATLLRKSGTPQEVRNKLNKLNWPNDIVDEVAFLMQTWSILQNPTPQNISQHATSFSKKNPDFRKELIRGFHPMIGHEVDSDHLSHLGDYEPPILSGQEIQRDLGLTKPGPEIGKEIARRTADHYSDSFFKWKNRPPMA